MSQHRIEMLWRDLGLPDYFLGNAGTNTKLYALHDAIVERCAVAAEDQDKTGREWVRDSLWENILRRAGSNVRKLKTEHRDGLNGPASNPVGIPDSSGDLASAGGIAGVDITDHRRQVGTPHDGPTIIPQQQTSGSEIPNNCPQSTTQEKT